MSTLELVPMSLCSQTVDGEEGPCKRQKLGISIDGEVLSSLINDIDDVSRTRLKEWFPVLAGSHETNDWSLQLKCFDPNLNGSKEAFSCSEFVGLCVWLLFTEHSEMNKIDVLEALQIVKSSFSKDPYMSNDVQPDEVIEENIVVVDVLCLDSREVKKQVCCALALSVSCNRDRKIAFGDGIQYKLIQLVYKGLITAPSPKFEDSNIICGLRTIACIAAYDTGMEKKIIETEINKYWLARIMLKTECVSMLVEACWILHFVVSGKHNETFWWRTVNAFIPGLIRWSHTSNFVLKRVALYAITSITSGASPEQMEELVEAGCIKALFDFARGLLDSPDFECFLDGLRNILNADENDEYDEIFDTIEGGKRRNEYAKIIDGIEVGWVTLTEVQEFCNGEIVCKAEGLLRDYAPEYLGKYW